MSVNPKQIQPKPRLLGKVTVDPAPVIDAVTIYSKEIGGITEMFMMDENGNAVQITLNGSVNLPAIPALVPTGGATDSVLAKSGTNDHITSWKKIHQLQREFYFVLPKGADIGARILVAGTISGLSLNTASDDPSPDAELGASTKTLVLNPVGLADIILAEVKVKKLIETGAVTTQGWNDVDVIGTVKSNTARTKGAIIDFQDYIDVAHDVMVYVRFVKASEMQAI